MGPQVFPLGERCGMKKSTKNSFAHGVDVDHCAKIPLRGTKKWAVDKQSCYMIKSWLLKNFTSSYVPGSKVTVWVVVIPDSIGNPCIGYTTPTIGYVKPTIDRVDDHLPLYGKDGSLDPSTCNLVAKAPAESKHSIRFVSLLKWQTLTFVWIWVSTWKAIFPLSCTIVLLVGRFSPICNISHTKLHHVREIWGEQFPNSLKPPPNVFFEKYWSMIQQKQQLTFGEFDRSEPSRTGRSDHEKLMVPLPLAHSELCRMGYSETKNIEILLQTEDRYQPGAP